MAQNVRAWLRVLCGLIAAAALALPAPHARAADAFHTWLETVWPEAQKIGVSRPTFDRAFQGMTPDLSLPELDSVQQRKPNTAQAEFLRPAGAYLNEDQIARLAADGRKVGVKHAEALAGIEQTYGVSRNILIAIFGRETDYGAESARKPVLRVIATEAYLGRRKDYFREQLIWALKMVEDKDVALADFRGSWAGAFGLTQFMPTGYRDYAVDGDGDGRKDVWRSVPDALATSAVELTKAVDRDGTDVAWQAGKPWGYEVRKPASLDCTLQGFDRPRPIRAWMKLGFTRAYDKPFRKGELDDPAFLLLPEGADGPAFLVFRNFLALKVYNYADLYALFVGHLADRIAGAPVFETPWAQDSHLTEAAIFDLQKKLVGLGYDVGKVDGKIGWKMRLALGLFEKQQKLPPQCYPNAAVVRALSRVASGGQ